MYKLNKYQSYNDYNASIKRVPTPNVSKVFKDNALFDVKYNKSLELKIYDWLETDGNCWIVTDITNPPCIVASYWLTQLPTVPDNQYHQLKLFSTCAYQATARNNNCEYIQIQNDGSNRVDAYSKYYNSSGSSATTYYDVIWNVANPPDAYLSVKWSHGPLYVINDVNTLVPSEITRMWSNRASDSVTANRGALTIMGENVATDIAIRQLKAGSKIYGFDIYSDSTYATKTHELRPAQMRTEFGLYDTINDKFYGNSGPGVLTGGLWEN